MEDNNSDLSQDDVDISQHDIFLQFYSADRHRIFRFIYSLVPVEADAEDVFQQTSIILWRKFEDFDQGREFFPWACAVAHHAVLNFRRASKRRRLFFSDELIKLLADARTVSSQRGRYRQDLLEECLAQLAPKDQSLINDVYRERSSASAVAKQRGKAVQTIYNRLNIIRNQLLDCINRKSEST
jgi:RNA polymerase sigma-70 factor (ECF subfamily)